MPKYYYEVDKFVKFKNEYLNEECKKHKILPSVENRITRIEWYKQNGAIDFINYYKELITADYLISSGNCVRLTKEEYYNSPQIKKQLLLKALDKLK